MLTLSDLEFSSDMSVGLHDSMGNDIRVVNAARRSMRGFHDTLTNADLGLIRSLIQNQHGSPFEMVVFEFDVDVPLFIAREVFRHRLSSFNEESRRYKETRPKFHVPQDLEVRTQIGKAMSYQYELLPLPDKRGAFIADLKQSSLDTYNHYLHHLDEGVARELTREFLPVNMYTDFMWKIDLRNLTNFLVLRNAPQAQYEIQKMAWIVEEAFEKVCPAVYKMWNDEGRPRLAAADE